MNSAPTFFGIPRVDFPSFAAYIALRCCWLTGGITCPPAASSGERADSSSPVQPHQQGAVLIPQLQEQLVAPLEADRRTPEEAPFLGAGACHQKIYPLAFSSFYPFQSRILLFRSRRSLASLGGQDGPCTLPRHPLLACNLTLDRFETWMLFGHLTHPMFPGFVSPLADFVEVFIRPSTIVVPTGLPRTNTGLRRCFAQRPRLLRGKWWLTLCHDGLQW